MRRTSTAIIAALATIMGLPLASPAALADGKVGVASVVKNDVQGRGRALSVGSDVFANERIKTGDASTAQFLFLDKTVMSMGPKAELTLDKFVYNPNRGGSGQVVVNAVQGTMRFVSGAQNPTNYAIKTPVATIGVRGTVFDLDISKVQTFVGVIEGLLVIRLLDGTTLNIGKGQYVIISASGTKTGPYNGSDPTSLEMVDWTRINEINELYAIQQRNYVAPQQPQHEVYPPPCYYCNNLQSSGR